MFCEWAMMLSAVEPLDLRPLGILAWWKSVVRNEEFEMGCRGNKGSLSPQPFPRNMPCGANLLLLGAKIRRSVLVSLERTLREIKVKVRCGM